VIVETNKDNPIVKGDGEKKLTHPQDLMGTCKDIVTDETNM
jgi:hypothetical protein